MKKSNSLKSICKKPLEHDAQSNYKHNLSKDDFRQLDSYSTWSSSDSDSFEGDPNYFEDEYIDDGDDEKVGSMATRKFKSIIDDMINLYSDSPTQHTGKCIIMPNNPVKICWDVLVLILLLAVSIIVPMRLAFAESEPLGWFIFYITSDVIFFIDIILSFFTAVSDENKIYHVTDKDKIAKEYIKSWFIIDFISILPIDYIMLSSSNQATILARFARIGKLYKLIRMIRLAKVLKLLKSKKQVSQFTQKLRINQGKERLIFFTVFFVFFFHISSCLFIFIGTLDYDTSSWMWDPYYYLMDENQLYIMSLYFIVTTTSTVGYGDLSASTTIERIYCVVIMLAGVTAFTFISGALSSILSNYDTSQAVLHENLLYLGKLRQQHNISDELFMNIRKALQYDSKNNAGLDDFIHKLPMHLRLEVSEEIHRDNFMRFDLFKRIGNKSFLAWVSSRMKQ